MIKKILFEDFDYSKSIASKCNWTNVDEIIKPFTLYAFAYYCISSPPIMRLCSILRQVTALSH